MTFDIVIIGGGIVGLATGYTLKKMRPVLKIAILEKENNIAMHQTGHNSGVIHSGIYYKPGSSKAVNCRKGYESLLNYCDEHDVKYELCGKIIVATHQGELEQLNTIYERGIANGLKGLKRISTGEAKEIEPHVNCLEGIFVPQTGIIDYKSVSNSYSENFGLLGGELFLGQKVVGLNRVQNEVNIQTQKLSIKAKLVINCAGLYSDKITELANLESSKSGLKIIPFRGEYYKLVEPKEHLVKNLIYPVPNKNFPFLGIHFTRMIGGGIEAGPNAVLAFKREGYKKSDINLIELYETLRFPGFRKIAKTYWEEGWNELRRSYSKKLFIEAMQKLVPEIQYDDAVPYGSGVRAQACSRNGEIVDDFSFSETDGFIHLGNAPSPAATSSLSIAQTISEKALNRI